MDLQLASKRALIGLIRYKCNDGLPRRRQTRGAWQSVDDKNQLQ
jgi:hypothetical protein